MRKNVDYKLEDIQNILSPVFEDQGFYFNPSQNQFIKNSKIGYFSIKIKVCHNLPILPFPSKNGCINSIS